MTDTIIRVAQAENLKLNVTHDPTAVVAEGQVDSHTSQALEQTLSEIQADDDLNLNLGGVSFIDSSGLRVIVRAHKQHLEHGGRLIILDPSDAVSRLLDITGLTSQLNITRTTD